MGRSTHKPIQQQNVDYRTVIRLSYFLSMTFADHTAAADREIKFTS
jgi:hypothetical protein